MRGHSSSGSNPSRGLPTALQLHILSLLPPNERTLSGRLAFRDAADAFSAAEDRTASIGQRLPPHTVPWALEAGQLYVRVLPFWHKFQLLCTAATSGSEVNLEVALALLQPSTFPEPLQSPLGSYYRYVADPGVAAVKAGHLQLLGWLLSHCPGLLRPSSVLTAAAQHCDLAGLQTAWEAVQFWPTDSGSSSGSSGGLCAGLNQCVLDAAAGSATQDAVAKMQWVLATTTDAHCRLGTSTAIAAARSGDLPRLQWLHVQGCELVGEDWNEHTGLLADASLEAAQWLVDEAGCGLPKAAAGTGQDHVVWRRLLYRVAQGRDGAAKLRWLQARRPPQLQGEWERDRGLLVLLVELAAGAGQLETVQSLVMELQLLPDGEGARGVDPDYAAGSGSVPVAACLRDAGLRFSMNAHDKAARKGDVAMVRWLVQEAGVSAEGLDPSKFIELWPKYMTARNRDLLEAVQVLVEVGRCKEWYAKWVLSAAAERGDLALVQYLQGQQEQGQRWPGGEALVGVARAGCEVLLEWLVERHPSCCMFGGATGSPYVLAAEKADRGTLAALRRLGVPWDAPDTVVQAVRHGCELPVLRWLVEQGAPVGRAGDMEEAVARRVGREDLNAEEAAWLRGLAGAAEAAAAAAAED